VPRPKGVRELKSGRSIPILSGAPLKQVNKKSGVRRFDQ